MKYRAILLFGAPGAGKGTQGRIPGTKPVLNFYGKQIVRRIDADQTPARVLVDILKHVVKV